MKQRNKRQQEGSKEKEFSNIENSNHQIQDKIIVKLKEKVRLVEIRQKEKKAPLTELKKDKMR